MSFSTVEDLALISKNFIGMSIIFVIQMHMPYLGNRMELWPQWKRNHSIVLKSTLDTIWNV